MDDNHTYKHTYLKHNLPDLVCGVSPLSSYCRFSFEFLLWAGVLGNKDRLGRYHCPHSESTPPVAKSLCAHPYTCFVRTHLVHCTVRVQYIIVYTVYLKENHISWTRKDFSQYLHHLKDLSFTDSSCPMNCLLHNKNYSNLYIGYSNLSK